MKRPFLLAAIALVVVWLVLHVGGARAYLGILSGTVVPSDAHVLLAVAYVLAWFGAVIGAPVLVLAHGIMAVWNRWRSSRAR